MTNKQFHRRRGRLRPRPTSRSLKRRSRIFATARCWSSTTIFRSIRMRGRMNDAKSYAPPQKLNEVMIGGTAGVVADSRHPGFAKGDPVVGMGGWQQQRRRWQRARLAAKSGYDRMPLTAYLGAVGMPGVTAWYGLVRICEAKANERSVSAPRAARR